jgi:hypothetical protein
MLIGQEQGMPIGQVRERLIGQAGRPTDWLKERMAEIELRRPAWLMKGSLIEQGKPAEWRKGKRTAKREGRKSAAALEGNWPY